MMAVSQLVINTALSEEVLHNILKLLLMVRRMRARLVNTPPQKQREECLVVALQTTLLIFQTQGITSLPEK